MNENRDPTDHENIGIENKQENDEEFNPSSLKSTEISATTQLIAKYGVNPVKTPVFLTLNAYRRMVGYAYRYANDNISSRDWREVYGILIGFVEDNKKVIIKDVIPMVVGDRAGVKYESKQYVDMAQIDESVYERSIQDNKDDFIIGWWHTHPGFKFFFSSVDSLTQLGYQIPNPFAVGLIFDHCELKSNDFFLGVAGLRMLNPDQGMISTYNFVDLGFEFEKIKMVKKVEKALKDINKDMDKVLKEVKYIDEILRKKALAQLQRNYGLILVPKREIRITDNEEEAIEDEKFLYEWDPEFFKKSFRIPKFREKIENEIKRCEDLLINLKNSDDNKKYEQRKEKFIKKIQALLSKPFDWYNKLMDDFTKRIEIISPFFDYLDTNERKIIEYFEARSSEYYKILEDLRNRAEFNKV